MPDETTITPAEARALAGEASGWHSPASERDECVTCRTPWPCASHRLEVAVESLAAQVEQQAAQLARFRALAERAQAWVAGMDSLDPTLPTEYSEDILRAFAEEAGR